MAVVVVEDDVMLRRAIGRALGSLSVPLLMADNAQHAREYFEHTSVDVLVADFSLGPNETVVSLLEHVREQAPDCMIYLMTGRPLNSLPIGPESYDVFLQKPFSLKDLKQTIIARIAHITDGARSA